MKKFDLDIILFTHGPGAYAPKRLAEEARKLNIKLLVIEYNDINITYSGRSLELNFENEKMPIPRGVLMRGLGEDSIYNPIRAAVIEWFGSRGSKILNSDSFGKWPCLDKTMQYINLVTAGIPVVESFSFFSKGMLKTWSQNAFPYIAKDVIGSSGEGVFKISGEADLEKLLKRFNSNYKIKGLLFQRFLPNAQDLRVIFLGGRIVGAMKRTARPGSYLSNYSQGGKVESYDISKDLEAAEVAIRTAKLFKLDYCGIDLMRNETGKWIVLEVNRACQFEGFEKSTGINVAREVIDYLAK